MSWYLSAARMVITMSRDGLCAKRRWTFASTGDGPTLMARDERRTNRNVFSLRLSHNKALAATTSGPAAALFAADAERRQGVDHAGGDRPALRGASGRLQQGRPEDAGISVAQSERKNSRDSRSQRSWRQAVAAVRIRRDPAIPRREDRTTSAHRSGAALADHPVAAFPDGRDRADVRPGRLLSQIRGQGFSGQAAAAALCRRGQATARGDRRTPR